MSQRFAFAFLLSMVFVFVYTSRYAKPPEPGTEGAESVAQGTADPNSPTGAVTGSDPTSATPTGATTQRAPAGDAGPTLLADAPEKSVAFDVHPAGGGEVPTEAPGFHAEWSSLGASLSKMELLDYETAPGSGEALPILGAVDGEHGSFLLRDIEDRYGLDRVHWNVEQDSQGGRQRLVFSTEASDGMRFVRTVTESDVPHAFEMSIEVVNAGAERRPTVSLGLQSARGIVDEEAGSQFYGKLTAFAVVDDASNVPTITAWSGKDLVAGEYRTVRDGETLLAAGGMTTYFAAVLQPIGETDVRTVSPLAVLDVAKLERAVREGLPEEAAGDARRLELLREQLLPEHRTNVSTELNLRVPELEPGESRRFDFRIYCGPKSQEAASLGDLPFLLPLIEKPYGNFAVINKSLLWMLRFFEGIFGNWGVAIILLTIVVKGLLFPLNRKQQISMTRYSAVMQKLKPQLEELKKKYKNNTRKYNEEQMKLLKAEGASPPLGGCLIMFLQIPVWVSLFQILGTSIELRQAPFFGWIKDLSRPDVLYELAKPVLGVTSVHLLPILMTVATIVQMRSQPKPADAQQAQTQKIMGLIMPIFMFVILYKYMSGLSLYIFTSSLIGIFEFHVIRRVWPLPTALGGARPVAAKA